MAEPSFLFSLVGNTVAAVVQAMSPKVPSFLRGSKIYCTVLL